jgi:pteridine reductase
MPSNPTHAEPVALVTGGARRIGAAIVRALHGAGMKVVVHYRTSVDEAQALAAELENTRANSVVLARGDLCDMATPASLIKTATQHFGRLDLLVNNASSFYPTPLHKTSTAQFDDLIGTNLKAPYFLAQAATEALTSAEGAIVNIADLYADRPMKSYPVYSAAKAALVSLTRSLARELAPAVRVNAIAPGIILWPEGSDDKTAQDRIIARTPLGRMGMPADIQSAVLFLARDAKFITGQVLYIDGGRSIVA